jgi:hypothetical protein
MKPMTTTGLTASQIADNITTKQEFRALERRLNGCEQRLCRATTERSYEAACAEFEVLQEAFGIAQSIIFAWQLIPIELDLDTPSQILRNAYKVFSHQERAALEDELGLLVREADWMAMDAYTDKEKAEAIVKPLLRFREIVESEEPEATQIRKINALAARSKPLADTFFLPLGILTPGEHWFAMKLKDLGVPLYQQLYKDGFTTPEKCLEIDPLEFSRRKGVGPRKAQQLIDFQKTFAGEG